MSGLILIGKDIWLADGATVSWYGQPYTTRSTIVRLSSGDLWVHSPVEPTPDLVAEVNQLGRVAHLVSPNKIHHLYLQQWKKLYPEASIYASPGLAEKRSDLTFDEELQNSPPSDWADDLDQLIFRGSPIMEEVVFFHFASKTLILTDLIENFPPDHFKGWRNCMAKASGIVSPNGKTPLDWRVTFLFGKKQARDCYQQMLAWRPDNIVLAHGECIWGDAEHFLARSFSWL